MPDADLPTLWLRAVAREDVAAALESVYADAARAIAERGPACWASGRCCNFDKTGHRLYVTGLEAAYSIAKLPEIAGTRAENFPLPRLPQLAIAQARTAGNCPFQLRNLCGVHPIKPLGCRVYFCDNSSHDWQHTLSERSLESIRGIHDRLDIPYRYGEWRDMLESIIERVTS